MTAQGSDNKSDGDKGVTPGEAPKNVDRARVNKNDSTKLRRENWQSKI